MTGKTGETAPLEFWFEFASTYSYLAAMRLEDEAGAAGVPIALKPFLLGPIFAGQGWNSSPFNLYPAKGRYMWREMERLTLRFGLPFRKPSVFPRGSVVGARVALAAEGEPWCLAFVRAVYRANFAEDRPIGEPAVVGAILTALGQDAAAWLSRADAPIVKDQLRAQTARAAELGIFGAPSFVTDGELFWGNDRLSDALAWCAGRRP